MGILSVFKLRVRRAAPAGLPSRPIPAGPAASQSAEAPAELVPASLEDDYAARVREVIGLQDQKLSRHRIVDPRAYWRHKGWPIDADQRQDIFFKLLRDAPTNFKDPLLLFERADLESADWLNMLACFLDRDTNGNPHFNAELAFGLWIHAARRGSGTACFNIAQKFKAGHERAIDLERAAFWFEQAFANGHGCSGTQVYNQRRRDPRYGDPHHEAFTAEVNAIPDKMMELSAPWGYLWKAKSVAGGWTGANDLGWAIRIYDRFVELKEEMCQPPVVASAWILGLRWFLDMDVTNDAEHRAAHRRIASSYLRDIPRESASIDVKFGYRWKADLLDAVVARIEADPALAAHYDAAKAVVHRLRDGTMTPQMFQEAIESGEIPASDALIENLWAAGELVAEEGWRNDPHYRWAARTALLKQLDLDDADLARSTRITGPRYNLLDGAARPVMGSLAEPAADMAAARAQQAAEGSYVPPPGVVSIEGVVGTSAGDVSFECTRSDTLPAMLLPEDFDVCIALAFGARQAIWPSLGLEPTRITPIKDELGAYNTKSWSPSWLGQTDFGRTLMVTDALAGDLVWQPWLFNLVIPADAPSERRHMLGQLLVDEISGLGGRSGEAQSGRIMLHPSKMALAVERGAAGPGSVRLAVEDAVIMIDGAYWSRALDGTEDRSVAINDVAYANGRAAAFVTSQYPLVSELIPVFERHRQIMTLFHGLVRLGQVGWQPSSAFRLAAADKLRRFEALPPLARNELLCR